MSAIRVDTIFEWCRDLAAVRAFYTDALGCEETLFDGERGWLTYQLTDTQIVFLESPDAPAGPTTWAENFHTRGEKVQSWVLRVAPGDFAAIAQRVTAAGYETTAVGDNEHMLFVRDPTGRTVEIWGEP